MSANVTFEAIRKRDFLPFFSAYLGGNRTRDNLWAFHKDRLVETGSGYVLPLDGLNPKMFLVELEEDMYHGHQMNACLEFLRCSDTGKFAFFIQISY